jgi:DNA-binding CsgD family transcriptional regulator
LVLPYKYPSSLSARSRFRRAQHDQSQNVGVTVGADKFEAANRLCDLVSADWFTGETYKGYLGRGVHDSLSVGAPVSEMAEGYYGFLRMRAGDPFTEADRDVALYAMRGLTWFHRQVLLAHGLLVARSPLSPIERRVFALLLTEQSEKSIASSLGVSPASAHTYVRDVIKKFGVSGRKGLVGLWLGRQS